MSLSAFDAVDDAIETTRSFLLPFDLGRWARLALVVFFLGGTGGANPFQYTGEFPQQSPQPGTGVPDVTPSLGGSELAIIAGIVVLVVLLALVFALVGAVMEFVFVESLRREEVTVRRYWGEHWRDGLRLFGFRLAVGLLSLLVLGGVLAVVFAPMLLGDGGFSFGLLVLAVPVFFLVALLSGLVNGFTTAFVVPVMLVEERGVLSGWRRFWPTLRAEWKEYTAYAVMRFVLQIAVGILVGIVTLLAVLVLAIPFGILGAVGFGLLSVSSIAGWAVIAVAGLLFALAVLLLSLFLAVPVQTFLRYYALLVLGDTNETFDLIPERRAAVRE